MGNRRGRMETPDEAIGTLAPHYRRVTRWQTLLLGGLCAGLVVAVLISRLGRWLEAPAQAPSAADVILVLGGGGGNRIVTGLNLYQQGMAPRLLLSGAEANHHAGYHDPIDWRADLLVKAGVPRASILLDRTSRNTWEEAVNALELMRAAGWHHVIVVSDPTHMRRLSWTWHQASKEADVSFVLVSAPAAGWNGEGWWRDEASRRNALIELAKIFYYYIVHNQWFFREYRSPGGPGRLW
jgi:uncharacterized SAM-binding protein YcdF (DUF218 family)